MTHWMKLAACAALAVGLAACGGEEAAPQEEAALEEAEEPAAEADPQPEAEPASAPEPAQDPAETLAASESFLETNAQREAVNVTESGLQYEVLESGPGDGEGPGAGDWVCAQYTGTLIDGTEFDSSRAEGRNPLAWRADGFIEGWNEALSMMKPGDRWMLYIHPDLAYGDQDRGPIITANSALIFDMELLGVLSPDEAVTDSLGRPDPDWDCREAL